MIEWDALKLIRNQSQQSLATARQVVPKISKPQVNIFKSAHGPKIDQFKKSQQPDAGSLPKPVRGASKPSVQPDSHKALLEKPAPKGGSGGLFQTLKSNWLSKKTPAPVETGMSPTQKLRQAMETSKMHIAQLAQHKPAATGQSNPFRTVEAVLLNQRAESLGLRNAAKTFQTPAALNGSNPASGIAAVAMPLTGVGLSVSPLVGPTALVMKPTLMNPFIAKIPTIIP